MGLDASVRCDCFEKGLCRTPPPRPELVELDSEGGRTCRSDDLNVLMEFDRWDESACAHPSGTRLHHRIGNIASVAFLREVIGRAEHRFPLIMKKVIYSGVHAGDRLERADIVSLRDELRALATIGFGSSDERGSVELFRQQMNELVDCALLLGKPIVF